MTPATGTFLSIVSEQSAMETSVTQVLQHEAY